MKLIRLLPLLLLLNFHSAFAASAFEDVGDFIVDQTNLNEPDPGETWAYVFELVKPDGTTKIISNANENVLVKPASTMKLFTGWWAFKEKIRTDAYLYQMLRQSVNAMAEETSQRMGGVLTMEDWYRDLGLDLNDDNFRPADGSGLSYDNKANCQIEMDLLKKIRSDVDYNRFKRLLAQPKKDGTLQDRLPLFAGKLFAKTGTLNFTASLSGFVETPKGTMVFCILSDYLKMSVASARKRIDNMVKVNYNLAK
jgi:D-alanyl-D-alanine carboxypeptidase